MLLISEMSLQQILYDNFQINLHLFDQIDTKRMSNGFHVSQLQK